MRPVCVCPYQLLKELSNFHEAWYERYAVGRDPKLVICNFLQWVITTQRTPSL